MLRPGDKLTPHEKAVADMIKKIEKGQAQESDLDDLLDSYGKIPEPKRK